MKKNWGHDPNVIKIESGTRSQCTVGDERGGQGISAPEHCIEDGCIKIEDDSDPKMIHIKIFFSGVFQLKIWKIVIFHYIGLGSL